MMNLDDGVRVAKIAKVREKLSNGDQEIDDIDEILENTAERIEESDIFFEDTGEDIEDGTKEADSEDGE